MSSLLQLFIWASNIRHRTFHFSTTGSGLDSCSLCGCHAPLVSLNLEYFWNFYSSSITLAFLKNTIPFLFFLYKRMCLLTVGLSDVFSWLGLGNVVSAGLPHRWYHIGRYTMSGILSLIGDIHFYPPIKMWPDFSTIKNILFHLKLISSLWWDDSQWCKYPAAH